MKVDYLTCRVVALNAAIESIRMTRLNGGDLVPSIMNEEQLDPRMAEMVAGKLEDIEDELRGKLARLEKRRVV